MSATSVFASAQDRVWKWRYGATIQVDSIAGGIPTDEKVAESWLRTKIEDKDDAVRRAVAETMAERAVSAEEAVKLVGSAKHFTGFKKDTEGLYIDGRQVKAALKEAVMVAVAAGNVPLRSWGVTSKFAKGFVAEHIMVTNDKVHIFNPEDGKNVLTASGIVQQFVHTQYGSAPHYKEHVTPAVLKFEVITDFDFDAACDGFWEIVWLTGQEQGVGASRSGGFGRYKVTQWDLLTKPPRTTTPKAGAKKAKPGDSEE
jgi:hypothetical protein